jgi:hypothetical protein
MKKAWIEVEYDEKVWDLDIIEEESLGRIPFKSISEYPPVSVDVLKLVEKYNHKWRLENNSYWLARLVQEVGELASSLSDKHEHLPEHELRQIASIAINWLDLRCQGEEEKDD